MEDEGILVIPTTIDPPTKLGAKEIMVEDYLIKIFTLSSLASMSGCCEFSTPLGVYDKCPVSVSLLARHGGDRFLLDTLQTIYTSLQEQVDVAIKSKSTTVVTQEASAEMAKEKRHRDFTKARVNAFVCDLTINDIYQHISPSSVDIVTMDSRSVGAITGLAFSLVFTWRLLRTPRGPPRRQPKRQASTNSSSRVSGHANVSDANALDFCN